MPNSLLFWSPNNLLFSLFGWAVSLQGFLRSQDCVHLCKLLWSCTQLQGTCNISDRTKRGQYPEVRQSATKCQWQNCCCSHVPQTLHQSSQLQWDRAFWASIYTINTDLLVQNVRNTCRDITPPSSFQKCSYVLLIFSLVIHFASSNTVWCNLELL